MYLLITFNLLGVGMDRVTVFDVYFHGYVESVEMDLQTLGPLLAHPLAHLFITEIQLSSRPVDELPSVSEPENKE